LGEWDEAESALTHSWHVTASQSHFQVSEEVVIVRSCHLHILAVVFEDVLDRFEFELCLKLCFVVPFLHVQSRDGHVHLILLLSAHPLLEGGGVAW